MTDRGRPPRRRATAAWRTMTAVAVRLLAGAPCALAATAHAETAYAPPPAASVPGYFADVMPCKIAEFPAGVECKGGLLDGKSLRELSILRNTIFARYGWDGYRKPWLRDHFHAQAWFKPNPKFTYKLLSEADRRNAHFIGAREQAFTEEQLQRMRDEIHARHGKVWNDRPEWTLKGGGKARACRAPKDAENPEELDSEDIDRSRDCRFGKQKWYKADPAFSEARLSAEDRIELGLLSRAMGGFALDDEKREQSADQSLERVLSLSELRALSLRDLRILRNSIYARRGRPFKSQILRDHFGGMSWYKVNVDYTDKLLTKNDTRNIALIRSVENEFGGPLSDEDWLIEPATDGA